MDPTADRLFLVRADDRLVEYHGQERKCSAICEELRSQDATAGDLNGDGKIDIVAVGRATKNVKIYWHE